jgi:hypothetical protein
MRCGNGKGKKESKISIAYPRILTMIFSGIGDLYSWATLPPKKLLGGHGTEPGVPL